MTAAFALPSIALTGQVITGQDGEEPQRQIKVDPVPSEHTRQPGTSSASTLEENRKPSGAAAPSPSAPARDRKSATSPRKRMVAPRYQYVGKHRGEPAQEALVDFLSLREVDAGRSGRHRVGMPEGDLGSMQPFNVRQGSSERADRGEGYRDRSCPSQGGHERDRRMWGEQ
ncbi:hypothetical protein [Streptomyces luteogriseus]|uniref:hypothetical protein n=1 Tax=Streptomyces luteogriseus TaxID=68233 RepID=UPI0037987FBD